MGGIVGIVGFKENPRITIENMLKTVVHRGLDQAEFHDGDSLQLGVCALKLGPSKTKISSLEDGAVISVFSGVLYNGTTLARRFLKGRPVDPACSSSEIILYLYQELGLDFLNILEGQFALALYDGRKGVLILARDPWGICPLFYSVGENAIVFGSEIKALAKSGEVALKPNIRALYEGFVYWSTSGGRTIFEDIYQVPPGCYAVLDMDKKGRVQRYLSDTDYSSLPDTEAVQKQLYTTLRQSLRDRMAGNAKSGLYLSGGLDSTILLKLADKMGYQDMPVFSVGFADSSVDESAYQALALKGHQGKHHRVMVREEDIIANLPQVLRHCETPLFKLGPVPMFMLSKVAQQVGVNNVLCGEGADELFYGYDLFKETQFRLNLAKDPSLAKDIEQIVPPQYMHNPSILAMYKEFYSRYLERGEDVLFSMRPRIDASSKILMYFSERSKIDPKEIDGLVASQFRYRPSALLQCQEVQMQVLLAGYLLAAQGDRMLAANSVQGQFPFLDQRVLELSLSIPDSLKLSGYQEKFILKQTFADIVPSAILGRRKYQYSAPGAEIFLRHKDGIEPYLAKETFESFGVFDYDAAQSLIQNLTAGRGQPFQYITEEMILTYIITTHMLLSLAKDDFA